MSVHRPTTLEGALEARALGATVLAGGTDLMVDVNLRGARPEALVDLSRVGELSGWSRVGNDMTVGATVSLTRCIEEIAPSPALAQACRTVGSRQIRNRATIGGNVVTASPAGDLLPFLVATGADAVVASERGVRVLPVDELLVGPRQAALADDELLIALRWTGAPGTQVFSRVARRASMALALASSCLVVDTEHRAVRIALGAVAPTVVRAADAEAIASDALDAAGWWDDRRARPDPSALHDAAEAAVAATDPTDDQRSSARYRRHAVQVLVHRQLDALGPTS